MVHIRLLQKNDFEQYIGLINQFRPINIQIDFTKFTEIYDTIFKNSEIYVACINDQIVGSITVIYEQKFIHKLSVYAHIEDVIVDEKNRHMKIGTQLLAYVKQICKEKGCFKCLLVCNDDVKKFYLQNDFEERGLNMSYLL